MLLGHRSDVSDLLVAADVFVFPSLWEGLGGAVIEALALEVPIVASDLPALREVVIDGENGVLVNPGEVSDLAEAIQTILNAPSTAGLVSGNRERFVAMFNIDARANEMIDLLRANALAE
jgi:glycosyltransferase involved in cell wall biosynthesis